MNTHNIKRLNRGPHQPGRNGQRGFTLIEIMIVVVILGVLGALIAPNIIGRAGDARTAAAKSDIRNIKSSLALYKLDNFSYPSTDQGLEALVDKPGGSPTATNWKADGYLEKLPVDPWGREYLYLSPGANGKFDLYSLGADGQDGGESENVDVKSWEI